MRVLVVCNLITNFAPLI